ncbi:hypothetical protein KKF29_01155, partial [Patescibacteria group bacterium]|nr:hypothetical protein [Patescibacteria group bacterium]
FFFLSYLLVNLKKIPVKKLIMHLIAILFVFLLPAVILFIANIFLKRKIFDSLKSVFLITTGGGIEEDLNIFTLNYIEILGGIVLVTSILGFVYLIINWKKHKIALALIISFLFVILIGIYQSLFGFHFFPRRLLAGLHIPAELLAGFYFIFLWKNKNKFLISLSVVIILICGLGNYYGQLKDLEFDLNWEYFETTNWASENLKENSKIMSDVLTIVQFQNISGKTPTFTYPRTKDHMQNNKAEAVQKIIVEPNAENAASYMKNNNVKYMIIDSEISPLWSPGNYEKFKNEEYFEEIYKKEINEDRFIIIYQIK